MCWVMPPASPATTLALRMRSSSLRLAVVDVAHHGDDRRARPLLRRRLRRRSSSNSAWQLDLLLLTGIDQPDLGADLGGEQLDHVVGERLRRGDHLALLQQEAHDVGRGAVELGTELLGASTPRSTTIVALGDGRVGSACRSVVECGSSSSRLRRRRRSLRAARGAAAGPTGTTAGPPPGPPPGPPRPATTGTATGPTRRTAGTADHHRDHRRRDAAGRRATGTPPPARGPAAGPPAGRGAAPRPPGRAAAGWAGRTATPGPPEAAGSGVPVDERRAAGAAAERGARPAPARRRPGAIGRGAGARRESARRGRRCRRRAGAAVRRRRGRRAAARPVARRGPERRWARRGCAATRRGSRTTRARSDSARGRRRAGSALDRGGRDRARGLGSATTGAARRARATGGASVGGGRGRRGGLLGVGLLGGLLARLLGLHARGAVPRGRPCGGRGRPGPPRCSRSGSLPRCRASAEVERLLVGEPELLGQLVDPDLFVPSGAFSLSSIPFGSSMTARPCRRTRAAPFSLARSGRDRRPTQTARCALARVLVDRSRAPATPARSSADRARPRDSKQCGADPAARRQAPRPGSRYGRIASSAVGPAPIAAPPTEHRIGRPRRSAAPRRHRRRIGAARGRVSTCTSASSASATSALRPLRRPRRLVRPRRRRLLGLRRRLAVARDCSAGRWRSPPSAGLPHQLAGLGFVDPLALGPLLAAVGLLLGELASRS